MSTPKPRSADTALLRRRRRDAERQAPLDGYKIAYPMVSADGTRVGFNGVALGRSQVYGAVADAVCVQSPRHRCPSSWCDCGFYCFHDAAGARDLACDPQYGPTVLLEVRASGRFIRYEQGLRYARQTVVAVHVARCGCGRATSALADVGGGLVGWRRLAGVCGSCAGMRPALTLPAFAALLGGPPVTAEPAPAGPGPITAGAPEDDAAAVPLLHAEVALLQARLDDLQRRLDRLTRP